MNYLLANVNNHHRINGCMFAIHQWLPQWWVDCLPKSSKIWLLYSVKWQGSIHEFLSKLLQKTHCSGNVSSTFYKALLSVLLCKATLYTFLVYRHSFRPQKLFVYLEFMFTKLSSFYFYLNIKFTLKLTFQEKQLFLNFKII